MAASRSVLEALLARVQQRAAEPRVSAVVNERPHSAASTAGAAPAVASAAVASAAVASVAAASAAAEAFEAAEDEDARTLPPTAATELSDEDIEEYDDELIEIIDDAEVIPQAAAAARAIDVNALAASLGRGRASTGAARSPSAPASAPLSRPVAAASKPVSVPASKPVSAPASVRGAVARPAAVEALRPESVAPRPVAAVEVAQVRGGRRELRASSFIELLDASLKLGV